MEPDLSVPDLAGAVLADACHLRVPSMPDWITPTVDYLVARASRCGAVEPGRDMKLMIALHEALTNAIIHGNLGISSDLKDRGDEEFARAVADRLNDPTHARRVVDIQASYDGHTARWVFHDQGAGFDAAAALRKLDEAEPDPSRPSGRGLMLIRAFTDEMRFEDGGRRLVLAVRRPGEKRKQPRWAMSGPVHVTPLDEAGRPRGDGRDAIGRNLSSGGIAFLADGMAPARRVMLTIPGERPIEVQAEVRHWQALEGNVVEVGCRFETPADWPREGGGDPGLEELGRLLERLGQRKLPRDERRSSPRVPYTERIEVELPGGEVRQGFGRDLARGGIAFLCAERLEPGEVRLRLPGDGTSIRLRARVVRATKVIDGFYDIGAQFVPG